MQYAVCWLEDGSNCEKCLLADVVDGAELPALLMEESGVLNTFTFVTNCSCMEEASSFPDGTLSSQTAVVDYCVSPMHAVKYVLPGIEEQGFELLGDLYPKEHFISFDDSQAKFAAGETFSTLHWPGRTGQADLDYVSCSVEAFGSLGPLLSSGSGRHLVCLLFTAMEMYVVG
ncbi:hypothetical protein NDU88_001018 [Pleurodeles waltl]|uniref:Uncharacterized protein n=1 Tax=Pleurodeles waltl TaxID=8319 RepID=A0AAV7P2Q0_PLEWA|nr:hypothetical protein NDU88_001018 [Pleurodeles waltl]